MTQLTSCCASDSGFTDYGLVVRGGIAFTGNAKVKGNAYIYGFGNATVDLPSCKVGQASDSAFEFDSSATSYKAASQYLTTLRPHLRISSSNVLASIGLQADPKYHVVTLSSCNGPFVGCPGAPFTTTSAIAASDARNLLTDLSALDRLSNAQGLLSGLSFYIGLNSSGLQWPTDATFVINVPITELTVLVLDSSNPSAGTDPCRTIWNFFPVDFNGKYAPNSFATVIRRSQQSLKGFILAPLVTTINTTTSNFTGLIVANNYNWETLQVDLQDFTTASSGKCSAFTDCVPGLANAAILPPTITSNASGSGSGSEIVDHIVPTTAASTVPSAGTSGVPSDPSTNGSGNVVSRGIGASQSFAPSMPPGGSSGVPNGSTTGASDNIVTAGGANSPSSGPLIPSGSSGKPGAPSSSGGSGQPTPAPTGPSDAASGGGAQSTGAPAGSVPSGAMAGVYFTEAIVTTTVGSAAPATRTSTAGAVDDGSYDDDDDDDGGDDDDDDDDEEEGYHHTGGKDHKSHSHPAKSWNSALPLSSGHHRVAMQAKMNSVTTMAQKVITHCWW
ncbi:hypothetical protein Unana1_04678 [Umbelopsis nana]